MIFQGSFFLKLVSLIFLFCVKKKNIWRKPKNSLSNFYVPAFRLTKYPLLFENLAKYSPKGSEEEKSVQQAVERSKDILNYVNQAVRAVEDHQRLAEIQKRLDKSAFEKVDHPMTNEFKVHKNYQ